METFTLSAEQSSLLAAQAAHVDIDAPPSSLAFDPTLQALGDQILDAVDREGLVVVEKLTGSPDEVLYCLMALVGRPTQDERAGPIIMDIKPTRHDISVETTSYYSWNEFDYHTDLSYVDEPPDFIAVFCVKPDAQGAGKSIFSDVRSSAAALAPQTISELEKPNFTFRAPPHYRGGRIVKKPVLGRTEQGDLTLTVRFDRLDTDGPEATQALEELYNALDANKVVFLVEQNAAYIVDNRRVVHGRTPFNPTFNETDRHLKRVLGMRRVTPS